MAVKFIDEGGGEGVTGVQGCCGGRQTQDVRAPLVSCSVQYILERGNTGCGVVDCDLALALEEAEEASQESWRAALGQKGTDVSTS